MRVGLTANVQFRIALPLRVTLTSGGREIGSVVPKPILAPSGRTSVEFDVPAWADGGTLAFYGSFNPKHFYGESKTLLCFGTDNNVYYPAEAMTLGACRSFFSLSGLNLPGSPTVEKIELHFDDPTGIFESEERIVKSEESGDAWYDLSGRRYVKRPSKKGIYIHGGEKIVVN